MSSPNNPPPPAPDQSAVGRADRLSDLPDPILLEILSFLPTHMAARTSLLSRRFRHLWKASPGLNFDLAAFEHRPFEDFLDMVNRSFLNRDPPSLLLHLSLRLGTLESFSLIPTLLDKARSFAIRHLVIELGYEFVDHFLPAILSIPSLESLSVISSSLVEEPIPPTLIGPTGLKRLCLRLITIEPPVLNQLLSKLPVLEDLELRIGDTVDLCSQTIKRLKLGMQGLYNEARICISGLESFDFYHQSGQMESFEGDMPMLQTAVIKIDRIIETSANAIYEVLKTVANVEELFIEIEEDWDRGSQFHNLAKPDMDPPVFANLKRLDLSVCFHDFNIEDLVNLLQHSPLLETLKLTHKLPFMSYGSRKFKKQILWKSKLPRIGGTYEHASFFDLHIGKKKSDLIKRLTRKLTSKRQKTSNG